MIDKRRKLPVVRDSNGNIIPTEEYINLFRNIIDYRIDQTLYFRTDQYYDLEITVSNDWVGMYWINEEDDIVEGGEFDRVDFLKHLILFYDNNF